MSRGPDRQPRRSGAQCAMCGIYAGNSRGIPVHRYRLQRTAYGGGRASTKAIASMGLCDTCIRERGGPVRDYSDRNRAVRHRHRSIRDPEVSEWHMHPDFRARHRHPELGVEEEH